MAKRNYLVEGGSGTGKSSVHRELRKRGYKTIDGDNEIAYKGDPKTGEPINATGFEYHLWDVKKVKEIIASNEEDSIFFCGGSRNFNEFIDLFDEVFILDIDIETLKRRLENREKDDWGGNDEQKKFIVELHKTKNTIPKRGITIDTNKPIKKVVDKILEFTE